MSGTVIAVEETSSAADRGLNAAVGQKGKMEKKEKEKEEEEEEEEEEGGRRWKLAEGTGNRT
ncbi:hypothetical protein K0M31_018518 [Melipona bicolor]|uniref:Uncharacterized protein n=1 Tax=Melipona bicolor TaxID=60889 RepID=A0AA40G3J7_9HYME|nr:hypothetical protein K0M31_018518 [Melipona bicolor]